MRAIGWLALGLGTGFGMGLAMPAAADFYTGKDIAKFCKTRNPIMLGYLAGWTDKWERDTDSLAASYDAQKTAAGKRIILPELQKATEGICVPYGASLGQMFDPLDAVERPRLSKLHKLPAELRARLQGSAAHAGAGNAALAAADARIAMAQSEAAKAAPPAHAAEAELVSADPALEKQVLRIAAELRCLVCQNQSLADSHAELALDLKNQVRDQLRTGRSEQDVIRYMTERYGDFVLYRPPLKNTTAPLWFGPPILLVAALVWRDRARMPAGTTARLTELLQQATGTTMTSPCSASCASSTASRWRRWCATNMPGSSSACRLAWM